MSGSEVDSSSINMERSVAVLERGLDRKRRPSLGDMRDMRYLSPEQVEEMVLSAASEHRRRESRQAFLQGRLMEHMYEEEQAAQIAGMMTQFIPTAEDNSVPLSKGVTLVEEAAQPKYRGLSSKSIKDASGAAESRSMKAITYGSGTSTVTIAYDPLSSFVPMAPNRRRTTITKLDRRLSVDVRPSKESLLRRKILTEEPTTDTSGKVVDEGLIPDDFLREVYGLAEDVRKDHRRMSSAVADMTDSLAMDPELGRLIAEQTLGELEEIDPRLQPSSKGGSAAAAPAVGGAGAESAPAAVADAQSEQSESRVKILEHRIALLEAELTRSRDPNASAASLDSSSVGQYYPVDSAEECRRLRQENERLRKTVIELEQSRMDVLIALNLEMERVRSLLKSYSSPPNGSREFSPG